MSTTNTLYAALGIAPDADPEAIEAGYVARCQALAGQTDELSLLRVAYDTLRQPEARAAYDRKLARQQASAESIVTDLGSTPQSRRRSPALNLLVLLIAAGGTAGFFWLKKPASGSKPAIATTAAAAAAQSAPVAATPAETGDSSDQQTPGHPAATPGTAPAAAPQGMLIADAPASPMAAAGPAPTRGAKKPGFDSQYISWSIFTVRQRNLTGSGVMIGPDRILTNCHVLAGGATNGLVVIHSMTGKVTKVEKYARLDGEDACLLLAPGTGNDSIAWGDSNSLRFGDTVHAFGHPGGSSEIVWSSAPFRIRMERGGETFLVSENYCRPGSSGGPLLDDEGRLVGVVTAVQRLRAKGGEPPAYGACISVTEGTARALLSKPLFPIALAPAQYIPNY